MNRMMGPRVFILDAVGGVPRAVSLAQACEQAGMRATATATATPAAAATWPRLTAALRARGAAAVLVMADAPAATSTSAATSAATSTSASAPAPHCHWLDAAHARGWVVPQAGRDKIGRASCRERVSVLV